MKTKEQIITELQKIKESTFADLYKSEKIIGNIIHFYKTYPQYEALDAFGAHILNVSLAYNNVGVWKFLNGDILFIGGVGSSISPAPLAGIGGNGLPLPNGFSWKKPETFLTLIEMLPKWNF